MLRRWTIAFQTSPFQIPITSGPDCCAIKSSHDSARRAAKVERGVAVVQENDAVVPQIAQGFLDVAHDLLIGVEPVDQRDVDGVLLEERRLVLEEGVAGRLEVMGLASPLRRRVRGRAPKA